MEDKDAIFFDGWQGLIEVLVSAPILYALVVGFVRLSGKRTTGQMNNFDWIVTVAMGSIVASGIVINTVSILEATLAVGLLLGMQYALTALAVRYAWVDTAVKLEPELLVRDGVKLERALRRNRITDDEIEAAIRAKGITRLSEVGWMILENDGSFSIVPTDATKSSDGSVAPDEVKPASAAQ